MRLRYAAYGSNLHPERLRRRVPSATVLGSATVHGWGLRFNKRGQDGSGKCNIVPSGERIHVAVFEMAARERLVLDRIEGLNRGYAAARLDVPGFGSCFTYRAEDGHVEEVLAPFGWYRELVLAGCELHRFPASYVESIRAIACASDPRALRHGRHMQIVRHARRHTRRRR